MARARKAPTVSPPPPPAKVAGSAKARRSAARLAAVQALYQIDLTGTSAETVITEFVEHRIGRDDPEGDKLVTAEPQLFSEIVRGAMLRRADIDQLAGGALSQQWSLERLETPLRAVLRAGTWELLCNPSVDIGIIINDYVEVAHAFFGGKEPGMVNGVLDRVARTVRQGSAADPGGSVP